MEKIPTPNSEDLAMPPNPMTELSEMPSFEEHMRQFDGNGSSSEMSQEEIKRFATTEIEAAANAANAAHEESERQEEQYNYAEEILPTPVTSDEEEQIFFKEFGGDGVALTASEPSSRLDRPILIRRGLSRPQCLFRRSSTCRCNYVIIKA